MKSEAGKTIVHLIPAEAEHLSIGIVESLILTSRHRNRFLITRTSKTTGFYLSRSRGAGVKESTDWSRNYLDVLKKHNHSDYVICDGMWNIIIECIKARSFPIVVHGGSRSIKLMMIAFGFQNLTWVSWGSGFQQQKNNSLARWINNYFKRLFFWRVDNVVCLMKPDSDYVIKVYRKKNTYTVPYTHNPAISDLTLTKPQMLARADGLGRVLLGNGGRHVKSYLVALEMLKKHRGKIRITCMLNYGLVKDASYELLLNKAVEYFGDDFTADESFYTKKEFFKYVQRHDIYICNVMTQTGLGTAGACINAGLKLYLAGSNYDWFKALGYYILNFSDIEKTESRDFIDPLPLCKKEHNHDLINTIRKRNIELREQFLARIVTS